MGQRDCSTAPNRRWFLRFPRSERVNECEASENVETRLVTGAGLLVHTFQYGQMRRHFRSGISRTNSGCGVLGWMWGCPGSSLEAGGRDAGRLITATEMRSRREHFRDWRQHHCTPELKEQLLRPFCLWDDFLIQFSFGTDATRIFTRRGENCT